MKIFFKNFRHFRFYSDEDFLINSERLELGVTPEGEVIDDVLLPDWAEVFCLFERKKFINYRMFMISSAK